MKVKDIDKLMEQLHNDKREAFSKHEVWLMLSEHNTKVPTVNVVPSEDRPTGEWIQIDPIGEFECSRCGWRMIGTSKFCPDCGLKMVTGNVIR